MSIEELNNAKDKTRKDYAFAKANCGSSVAKIYADVLKLIDAEIASQSVTDEDVKDAIAILYDFQAGDPNHFGRWLEDEVYECISLAITALRQIYTEPCEWCSGSTYCQFCGRKLVTK